MTNITKPANLNEIWAATGVKTKPATSKVVGGWVVELPPYQTANWIEWKQDQALAHINQHGVAQWDSTTEYIGGVSYSKGSDGVLYKCLQTHTGQDPANPLNSAYWTVAFEPYGSVAVVANNLATLQSSYNTLSALTSYAQARTNLSVYSKAEGDVRYAPITGNASQAFSVALATAPEHAVRLSQLSSAITAATETSAGKIEIASQGEVNAGEDDERAVTPLKAKTAYLSKAGNLGGLVDVGQARINLGLGTIATGSAADYLTKAGNLSGLTSTSQARTNLGLGTIATENANDFLTKSGNLAGVASAAQARTNLGLGNAAVRDVGTTAGTLAAGDDYRILTAVPNVRQVLAGNGLIGGGTLGGDVTVHMGTPATISPTSGNRATLDSHSHSIDFTSFFSQGNTENSWYIEIPGVGILQWGNVLGGYVDTMSVQFAKPMNCQSITITHRGTANQYYAWDNLTTSGFTSRRNGSAQHWNTWIAVGKAL